MNNSRLDTSVLGDRLRTLREVCHERKRDDDGKACPNCFVRDICEKDHRRALAEAVQEMSGVG